MSSPRGIEEGRAVMCGAEVGGHIGRRGSAIRAHMVGGGAPKGTPLRMGRRRRAGGSARRDGIRRLRGAVSSRRGR